MGHFLFTFMTPNPQFTGFGARLLRFVSFSRVSHFCKNVCLSTVEMSTVAQKRRGQNNETYVLAFQVFGDVKKHYFLVVLKYLEILICLILFNLEEGGIEADYSRPV
jgi:hypothetical protein